MSSPYKIFTIAGQLLITTILAVIAVAYDISVPEISGDLRWVLIHAVGLALAIGWAAACVADGLPARTGRIPLIIWLTALLVGWAGLSMLWTLNPYHTWWGIKHLAGYAAFMIFIYLLRDECWYRRLLWALTVGLGFNCIIGIAQFYELSDAVVARVFPGWNYITAAFSATLRWIYAGVGTDKALTGTLPFFQRNMLIDLFQQTQPPAGTLAKRNLMGSYLVATLPAAVFLTISERGIARRLVSGLILGLGLIMLAYTRSRASWLAFMCMPVLVAGWLICQRRQRGLIKSFFSRRLLIGLTVMAAAALAAGGMRGVTTVGRQSVVERFQALLKRATADDPDNSFGIRLVYNLNGMAMVRDRPLRGVGLGAFHTAYPAYYRAIRPTPAGGFSTRERPTRMHNDLGQAFIELGIPGGLTCIMIFACLAGMAWRTGRRAESREASLMSLCLTTAVCGLGLNALADFPLQLPMSSMILWSYAGMITGLYVMHAWAPATDKRQSRHIPRLVYVLLTILFATGGWAILRDDLARRRGAQYLKGVMTLANAGRFDEPTLLLLGKSMEYYQWNARLQDYRALVYANYRGTKINVNTYERVSQVEAATRYDPYSPHKLINLGGLYIIRAHELIAADAGAQALKNARLAENVFETMLNYPDFFADRTYVLGGMANLLQAGLQPAEAAERIPRARALLEKALEINPRNKAAREALARISNAAGK